MRNGLCIQVPSENSCFTTEDLAPAQEVHAIYIRDIECGYAAQFEDIKMHRIEVVWEGQGVNWYMCHTVR